MIAKSPTVARSDYPAERLHILFVTDGSTDGTPEALAAYADVTVLHTPVRLGKAGGDEPRHALCAGESAHSHHHLYRRQHGSKRGGDPAAGAPLCRPDGGLCGGEKRVHAAPVDQASSSGESLYWRYESTVKRWESTVGNVMGAAGELFAIRSDCYLPLPHDTLIDDFVLSFRIAMQGKRMVYEPDAYALEHGSASIGEEWKRKRRIAAGGIQAILWLTPLLNPLRYGLLSWQYVSHRVLRWTVTPLALVLLLPLNAWLAWRRGGLYALLWPRRRSFMARRGWAGAWRGVAYAGKLLFVPFYFTLMNLAVFAGFPRFMRGRENPVGNARSGQNKAKDGASPAIDSVNCSSYNWRRR